MKELGEYLRETRERNGVSVEEAADDLKIDSFDLESLEAGNVRAFKDVLSMKEIVAYYAKYLGLDSEDVLDEFNDFLFEHTSKISLDDILEAQKKDTKEKKVVSPYTLVKAKKINKKYVYFSLGVIVFFLILIYLIILIKLPKKGKITEELLSEKGASLYYEFTN